MNRIERDKTLFDMVITAELPSEAWENCLSVIGDEGRETAQDKVKKEIEKLTFKIK